MIVLLDGKDVSTESLPAKTKALPVFKIALLSLLDVSKVSCAYSSTDTLLMTELTTPDSLEIEISLLISPVPLVVI